MSCEIHQECGLSCIGQDKLEKENAELRKLFEMKQTDWQLRAYLEGYKTALEAERSVKNDLSAELNELKWLHDQACNLVIPGDVDSPEAYRILLKQMREVLKDCVSSLQKIDEPMKFHHWEEDPYTRAACFQFVACEAINKHADKLKKWGMI